MQFLVISEQLSGMLVALALGAILGLLYDFLRALRCLFPFTKGEVLIANAVDILYSVFAGISFSILLYSVSHGRYRWFNGFSVILGFSLYRMLPGKLIKPFLFWLIGRVLVFLGLAFLPLKKLFGILCFRFRALYDKYKYNKLLKKTDKLEKELCRIARFE